MVTKLLVFRSSDVALYSYPPCHPNVILRSVHFPSLRAEVRNTIRFEITGSYHGSDNYLGWMDAVAKLHAAGDDETIRYFITLELTSDHGFRHSILSDKWPLSIEETLSIASAWSEEKYFSVIANARFESSAKHYLSIGLALLGIGTKPCVICGCHFDGILKWKDGEAWIRKMYAKCHFTLEEESWTAASTILVIRNIMAEAGGSQKQVDELTKQAIQLNKGSRWIVKRR